MSRDSNLDALWREHRRFVAAVLLAHLPPGVELDDLLQDVATKVVEHAGGLRDPDRARSWLRAIAVNVAASARRKHVVRRVVRRIDESGAEPVDPGGARESNAAAARDFAGRVLELARALPPELSEPLLLKSVQGMSQRAIAEALGLPETTIETRLVRARAMLRAAVEQDEMEAPAPALERVAGNERRSRP